jgi:glycosyltransferase involved in cell wall biosynthesis
VETYNRASTISEVIQNIVNQTCQNFELIIVDSGSTDGTLELVRESLKHFEPNRLSIVSDSFTRSEIVRWNRPLKMARGRFIAICEGDDYFAQNHLELAKRELETFSSIENYLYTTELESFSNISEGQNIILPSEKMLRNLAMFKWCPAPSQVIFSRLINGVPFFFDEKAHYAGEYSLYEAILSADGILIRNELETVSRGYRYYPRNYTHIADAVQLHKRTKDSKYMDKRATASAQDYLAKSSLYFLVQQAVQPRFDYRLMKTFLRYAKISNFRAYLKTARGSFAHSIRMKKAKC